MRFYLVLALFFLTTGAQAAIVCEGQSRLGSKVETTIDGTNVSVKVTDGVSTLHTASFANVDDLWDGHKTGLITAPGLSVKYEDQFGCIRNVVVVTNIRGGAVGYIDSISSATCRGGSTGDDICLGR